MALGLYTICLTVTAIRLMVEYGMAKLSTVCQAILWDCLRLQDGCEQSLECKNENI